MEVVKWHQVVVTCPVYMDLVWYHGRGKMANSGGPGGPKSVDWGEGQKKHRYKFKRIMLRHAI